MEWLRQVGTWAMGGVAALAGLAVFVVVFLPLGHWFWDNWLGNINNAVGLIAAGVLIGGFGALANYLQSKTG